jgi:hypothetical protein
MYFEHETSTTRWKFWLKFEFSDISKLRPNFDLADGSLVEISTKFPFDTYTC